MPPAAHRPDRGALIPAVPGTLAFPAAARPLPGPGPNRALLGLLRGVARELPAARRIDLAGACALIARGPDGAPAYAAALLRGLPQGLGRRLVFHRPGAAEVTFDESWTTALVTALARGDPDGARLMLGRLAPPTRRPLRFLAQGLADRLESLYLEQF